MSRQAITLLDKKLIQPAVLDAFKKLSPATQWKNPVMFVVYVGSIITTLLFFKAVSGDATVGQPGFILAISLWLWFTVLFANFAEALAEGRSRAQAASLRGMKQQTWAKKLAAPNHGSGWNIVEGYVLTPGRYVGAELIEEDAEPFAEKYPRLVAELDACFAEGERLTKAIRDQLGRVES